MAFSLVRVADTLTIPGNKIGLSHFLMFQSLHLPTHQMYQTLVAWSKLYIHIFLTQPDVPLIKILHLSDIHLDLEYTEGLNAKCGEPLCCRPPNNPAPPGQPAGRWGDHLCDLPLWTANNLFEHLAQHKDEFDWVYWTGDLPAHNDWSQSRSDQLELLQLLSTQMKLYLGDKKIYPTLGNHESAPVNRSGAIFC